MKVFKNILIILFLVGAAAFTFGSFYLSSLGPCEKPIEYRIGRFDPQFGVTLEEFKKRIVEAESVWENFLGKDLFIYDPDADFKINLIYDERQISTIQRQRTESGLTAIEKVLDYLDKEFSQMKVTYETMVKNHENAIASFERRQKEYIQKVNFWNKRGGAPKDEYEVLQQESLTLKIEADRINAEVATLKLRADELNAVLGKRNLAAKEYNKVAEAYNQKYGKGLEFDQAEYTGDAINVYQFGGKNDLKLALVHELGHAIGLGHVDTAGSVMYYLASQNTKENPNLSAADIAELEKVCKIK